MVGYTSVKHASGLYRLYDSHGNIVAIRTVDGIQVLDDKIPQYILNIFISEPYRLTAGAKKYL